MGLFLRGEFSSVATGAILIDIDDKLRLLGFYETTKVLMKQVVQACEGEPTTWAPFMRTVMKKACFKLMQAMQEDDYETDLYDTSMTLALKRNMHAPSCDDLWIRKKLLIKLLKERSAVHKLMVRVITILPSLEAGEPIVK